MQPYRPAPRPPGPGDLAGGIVAIVATGAGSALAAELLMAEANASYALVVWVIRAIVAVTVVAVVPFVLRWVRLRRPGAVRREVPGWLIFGLAAGGLAVFLAAVSVTAH